MPKTPGLPDQFIMYHCPVVLAARKWRTTYKIQNQTVQDDCDQARCEFQPAGTGFKCKSCFLEVKNKDEFLSQIADHHAKIMEGLNKEPCHE